MSKSVTVPTNKGNPVVVYCNGKKYIYTAGETATVPDEVAELFANSKATEPVTRTDTNDLEKIEAIAARVKAAEGNITGLGARVTALDDEDTGVVPALNTRLTALDDETTGIVPDHEARIKVLEQAAEAADGGSGDT